MFPVDISLAKLEVPYNPHKTNNLWCTSEILWFSFSKMSSQNLSNFSYYCEASQKEALRIGNTRIHAVMILIVGAISTIIEIYKPRPSIRLK